MSNIKEKENELKSLALSIMFKDTPASLNIMELAKLLKSFSHDFDDASQFSIAYRKWLMNEITEKTKTYDQLLFLRNQLENRSGLSLKCNCGQTYCQTQIEIIIRCLNWLCNQINQENIAELKLWLIDLQKIYNMNNNEEIKDFLGFVKEAEKAEEANKENPRVVLNFPKEDPIDKDTVINDWTKAIQGIFKTVYPSKKRREVILNAIAPSTDDKNFLRLLKQKIL